MMRYAHVAIGMLALALSATAAAVPVPEAVQGCVTCHGERGEGSAQGPALAGQSAEYLDAQLEHFIAGRRSNPLMTMMAQSYADPQLRQPAVAYFAAQGQVPTLQLRGQRPAASAAEKLYYEGDLTRNIPACYSCHGPAAVGGGPFPRLAGQQAEYLAAQLRAWQKGERKGDLDNMMGGVAGRLNEQDIQALASYLAAIR